MNKPFATMLAVNSSLKQIADTTFRIEENLIATRTRGLTKFIVEELYKAYKDTDITKVLVIDMDEFERFLRKMLPLWFEETKGERK